MSSDTRTTVWLRGWQALRPSGTNRVSHLEKWLSAVGGFIGILAVLWFSSEVLDQQGAALVVGSMGASAVLLFAVPHGALSQPWPVFGGHLISAIIGVSCAQVIPDSVLGAALGVGLAIGAMHYLQCIHPPGGATALVAVLGGDGVHQLGYSFVVTPVLENVMIILAVALVVNLPFNQRRYPAALSRFKKVSEGNGEKMHIAHSDLVYALSQVDSFIDVSEQDLIRIYNLAVHHTQSPVPYHQLGEGCELGRDDCLCRRLHVAGGEVDV